MRDPDSLELRKEEIFTILNEEKAKYEASKQNQANQESQQPEAITVPVNDAKEVSFDVLYRRTWA